MKLHKVLIGLVFVLMFGMIGCDGDSGPTVPKISPIKMVYDGEDITALILSVEFEGMTWEIDVAGLMDEQGRSGEATKAEGEYTLDEMKTMLATWIVDKYFPLTSYSEAIRSYIYCEAAVYNNGEFLGNTGIRGAVDTIDSLTIELLFGFVDPPFSNGLCM